MLPDTTITLGEIPPDRGILQEQFFLRPALPKCLAELDNYVPRQPERFLQSFTHASFAHQHPRLNLPNYQPLEFLGDAVINMYIADKLCRMFPHMREGELSALRSFLVCGETLARLGKHLNLEQLILLGKGTTCSTSLLGDVLEAIVGCIYQDQGFERTGRVLDHLFSSYQKKSGINLFHPQKGKNFDKKSCLQEMTLKLYGETPQYSYQKINQNCFQVDLRVAGYLIGSTQNTSKKEAEKILAEKALKDKFYQNISPDKT